jgi:hypothetical protein
VPQRTTDEGYVDGRASGPKEQFQAEIYTSNQTYDIFEYCFSRRLIPEDTTVKDLISEPSRSQLRNLPGPARSRRATRFRLAGHPAELSLKRDRALRCGFGNEHVAHLALNRTAKENYTLGLVLTVPRALNISPDRPVGRWVYLRRKSSYNLG